jgi:trimeric autotransporter adhesin
LFHFIWIAVFTCAILSSPSAFSAGAGITYQGRILKPDGTPLDGTTVEFHLQIRTPDGNSCLMYEETQTLDLSETHGNFSLTLNSASSTRTDSTGLAFERLFSNRSSYVLDPLLCSSGSGVYTPSTDDGRELTVLFKDENMTAFEPMPAQKINYVPYAFEAKQIQGFNIGSLVRVADGASLGNISPLSNASYNELLALINGTSTQYTKSGQLAGSAMPAMSTGQVLGWNGSAWTSTDAVPATSVTLGKMAADSVDSSKVVDGSITSADLSPSLSIATTGVLSASAVGVGTASPTTKLDVFGSAVFRGPTVGGIDGELYYDTTSHAYMYYNAGAGAWQSFAGGAVTYNGTSWGQTGSNVHYTAGNVGVGTTTPTSTIGFGGTTARQIGVERHTTANTAGSTLTVRAGGATAAATDKAGGALILASGISTGTGGSSISFQTAKPQTASSTTDNTPATRMTIASSGNVGIGNTSPVATLHVNSGAGSTGIGGLPLPSALNAASGYVAFGGGWNGSTVTFAGDTANNGGGFIHGSIFGGMYFAPIPSTGGSSQSFTPAQLAPMRRFSIASSGVTVTAPTTTGTSLNVTNTDTGGANYRLVSTGSANSMGAGNFLIQNVTAGTIPVTVSPTGNVGIGSTTPQATLDVNGFARLKPHAAEPIACSPTNDSALAMTSRHTLCACDGSNAKWVSTVNGLSDCVW